MKSAEEQALPVCVGAVFSRRGVLLVRREYEPFVGLWGMPGGKMRHGEHVPDAVEREVLEETGIEARFRELCGVVTESVIAGSRLERHYLLLACRLSAVGVQPRRSREGEVRWFDAAELIRVRVDVVPSDLLMLERLILRRGGSRYYRCVARRRGRRYDVESFE